jgi:hypothetical protein
MNEDTFLESHNPAEIECGLTSGSHETTLATGQRQRVRLKGSSSTGYAWSYTLDAAGVSVVRITLTHETKATPVPFRSFRLDQIATVEAVGAGKAMICFVLRQPWQKLARSEHELAVTVV